MIIRSNIKLIEYITYFPLIGLLYYHFIALPDDDNDVFTPEPLDPAMIADGKVCVFLYIVVIKL
jgi:hypothetical protein